MESYKGKPASQIKPLIFTTGRLVNVIISVGPHGKDPYRDTSAHVYLNNCKETVENYCLNSQCFTSLDLPVSDLPPHSVPVVDWPAMWRWSGHSWDDQLACRVALEWPLVG